MHQKNTRRIAEEFVDVIVPGNGVTISASAEQLLDIAPKHKLFYRGGRVVELIEDANGDCIEILDAAAAQSRFEDYVQFKKISKTGNVTTHTPTNINETKAKAYLKSRKHIENPSTQAQRNIAMPVADGKGWPVASRRSGL